MTGPVLANSIYAAALAELTVPYNLGRAELQLEAMFPPHLIERWAGEAMRENLWICLQANGWLPIARAGADLFFRGAQMQRPHLTRGRAIEIWQKITQLDRERLELVKELREGSEGHLTSSTFAERIDAQFQRYLMKPNFDGQNYEDAILGISRFADRAAILAIDSKRLPARQNLRSYVRRPFVQALGKWWEVSIGEPTLRKSTGEGGERASSFQTFVAGGLGHCAAVAQLWQAIDRQALNEWLGRASLLRIPDADTLRGDLRTRGEKAGRHAVGDFGRDD